MAYLEDPTPLGLKAAMPQHKVYNLQSVTGRQIALQLYFVMKVQVKTIGQLALCKSAKISQAIRRSGMVSFGSPRC